MPCLFSHAGASGTAGATTAIGATAGAAAINYSEHDKITQYFSYFTKTICHFNKNLDVSHLVAGILNGHSKNPKATLDKSIYLYCYCADMWYYYSGLKEVMCICIPIYIYI